MIPNIRLIICLSPLFLVGCSHVSYLAQAAHGQREILARRQSIENLVEEVGTPRDLRRQLYKIQAIRRFASTELALPDNGSYHSYSDLQRPYAVWNVVAAPEFSVAPRRWCFPIAGCVTYRGYFNKEAARKFAGGLQAKGDDVFVGGVAAYSTLGWFDDPVLNTFIHEPQEKLAALIFHELAHQVIYVKDDTPFNESFAVAVEREGVKRWLEREDQPDAHRRYLAGQAARQRGIDLMLNYRGRLETLYADPAPDPETMRRLKQEILSKLRQAYWTDRNTHWDHPALDGWFRRLPNNALLAAVSAYYELAPAFEKLLEREGGNLARFYRRVEEIAALDPIARRRALQP